MSTPEITPRQLPPMPSGFAGKLWRMFATAERREIAPLPPVSYLREEATQIVCCAWCEGRLVAENLRSQEKAYARALGKSLSHGICPVCSEKYFPELKLRRTI